MLWVYVLSLCVYVLFMLEYDEESLTGERNSVDEFEIFGKYLVD